MAKSESSKREGLLKNFSSGDEDDDDEFRVEYRLKTPARPIISQDIARHRLEEDLQDEFAGQFDHYGQTPPRTRIKIKNRDWDRKQKSDQPACCRKGMSRMARSRVQRRNTMDCAILNQMFIDEESKKSDKRAQALLREAERDMKQSMAITSATNYHSRGSAMFMNAERLESIAASPRNSGVPTLVESCNRYMSVSSRPVGCRSSAPPTAFLQNLKLDLIDSKKLKPRKEFHETFANLIKLGSTDRQDIKPSHEEYTWQTELKDMIWLELQAWHADRTLEQQDKYLFTARQGISDLLNQILTYKFNPKYMRGTSTISVDSGLGSDGSCDTSRCSSSQSTCKGCFSMYCKDCNEQQSHALKEVEELLTRLETAEALYPSTQVMAAFYPVYKCEAFVGRVKAMCLWYNITRHLRLKLIILGKLLARLQGDPFNWPTPISASTTESSASSSAHEVEDAFCSGNFTEPKPPPKPNNVPKVQFNLVEGRTDSSSPSDSISSTDSNSATTKDLLPNDNQSIGPTIGNYGKCINDVNMFNVQPLAHITYDNVQHSTMLYRKYIENMLKSRGLNKSLSFLHRLHNTVLHKAHVTLERPGTEEYESEIDFLEDDVPQIEPHMDKEKIEELRRYGCWSAEAKAIGLPSYVPTFIFLSVIPLEVIHEFLRMRLETRPAKPNPLSLEQLMKELREGLTLALTHRERFNRHITTALNDNETELEKYSAILDQFDATVKKVLELYLDYVDQWVLVAAPEGHKKSALEKEWMFTKLVSPMIPGMHQLAAKKFCLIIRNLLRGIGDRLVKRASELDGKIDETTHEDALKWQLLTICRETQSLFTTERERAVKVLFFAKTFSRDTEQSDFHREHYDEYLNRKDPNDFECPALKEAFTLLKRDVLDVRDKLIKIILRIEERCNIKNMLELDEQDRLAVLSRSREILHQGYKFGFEYNKDVIRLFEQKPMSCNSCDGCTLELSLGIIEFAKMWMKFVTERCERGRGVRPRWATQGLEFLILACDPLNTRHLDDKQFEDLKTKMDGCISHVIGIISEPEKTKKKASPRTRKTSSPATSRSRTPTRTPMSAGVIMNPSQQKFLQPQFSLKEDHSEVLSTNSSIDTPDLAQNKDFQSITLVVPTMTTTYSPALRQIRVRDAVNRLDMELENKLRERNLIGQVKTLNTTDKIQIRARSVNFRWHRGIKIGQGRFGKVYTAVNNSTGELMAMKEITIQPGETRAIKKVAEELKILEGINHKHLVKYYGIEIHREELLIFMELCSEGTLESLVELSGGLHEGLARRFTAQLLSGVEELHKHGIVHRDIKTANIFLVDGGNSLKLGDFGSAVKIQAHTTVPGELQGYVGTQAYMAPEVFTKTNTDGHGRAADIWSVGCVVIEMVSGKRPWYQFDSNFQIMFKVGMGETPEIPSSLSQEGCEFLENCLQHDPKKRMTASELLQHNFCKVELDEDTKLTVTEPHIRRSFRRGNKT